MLATQKPNYGFSFFPSQLYDSIVVCISPAFGGLVLALFHCYFFIHKVGLEEMDGAAVAKLSTI